MSKWCVYLLTNGRHTYIGSTTDVRRRLRQHNGEIRGGARATSRTPGRWRLVCWVSGFSGRSQACRWERIIKCRFRGLEKRRGALMWITLTDRCPVSKVGQKKYPVPPGLVHWVDEDPI